MNSSGKIGSVKYMLLSLYSACKAAQEERPQEKSIRRCRSVTDSMARMAETPC